MESVPPAWCEVLRELHQLVGRPGRRTVESHARVLSGGVLSKSTVGSLLNGTTNPRESSVEAFVRACLHYARSRRTQLPSDSDDPEYWMQRFRRAASGTMDKTSRKWPVSPQGAGYRFEAFGHPVPRAATGQAPSYLLDSRYEVVPFRDRGERQALQDWLDDPAFRTSVRLVHGDGGQGKTRLAMQVARRAAECGWFVVQAFEGAGPAVRGGDRPRSWRLLVVVDYTERWSVVEVLMRMVLDLAEVDGLQCLRVLLLARSEGLWEVVAPVLDRQVDHLADPLRLAPFTTGALEEVGDAFNGAVASFQSAMQIQRVELAAPRLSQEIYGSPLGLHMAALAAVWAHENQQSIPSDVDLSTFLLTHERRYWMAGMTADLSAVMASAQVGRVSRTVLIATLFGSLVAATARHLLRAAHLADSDAAAQSLIDQHDQLYPVYATQERVASSHLRPLYPDRFAEDFVASCVHRPGDRALIVDLVRDVSSNGLTELKSRSLTVLAETAARHPHVNLLLDELDEILGMPTAYAHVNSRGTKYYLHRTSVTLRGNPQTIYFFARVRRNSKGEPAALPEDRVIRENPRNGFLTISKKKS